MGTPVAYISFIAASLQPTAAALRSEETEALVFSLRFWRMSEMFTRTVLLGEDANACFQLTLLIMITADLMRVGSTGSRCNTRKIFSRR